LASISAMRGSPFLPNFVAGADSYQVRPTHEQRAYAGNQQDFTQ